MLKEIFRFRLGYPKWKCYAIFSYFFHEKHSGFPKDGNAKKDACSTKLLLEHFSTVPTFPTCYTPPFYGKIRDMNKSSPKKFLGMTTLGKKGQIVIPAEARVAMKLAEGDRLIVMSAHEDALIIMKASRFETMASHFTEHLASVRKLMKKK